MDVSSAGLQPKSDCFWQGPKATIQVNYSPIPSSEKVPHIKKSAIVRDIKEIWSWDPDGIPAPRQTSRLTVGHKLTSTPPSSPCSGGIWVREPYNKKKVIVKQIN
jgi:hypothetical protein